MPYEIRDFEDVTTERLFETLEEVYSYVAGAIDLTAYDLTESTIGPWALWRVGDGDHQEVLGAGVLLERATAWRVPRVSG